MAAAGNAGREAANGGSLTGGYPDFRKSDNVEDRRHESAKSRVENQESSGYVDTDNPEIPGARDNPLSQEAGITALATDAERFREKKKKLYDETSRVIRQMRKQGSDLPLPQHGRPYLPAQD